MAARKSREEIINLVGQVQKLKDRGIRIKDACKQVGIGTVTFYSYRNELRNAPKKETITDPTSIFYGEEKKSRGAEYGGTVTFQGSSESRGAFIVYGSPAELAEFARSYGRG